MKEEPLKIPGSLLSRGDYNFAAPFLSLLCRLKNVIKNKEQLKKMINNQGVS